MDDTNLITYCRGLPSYDAPFFDGPGWYYQSCSQSNAVGPYLTRRELIDDVLDVTGDDPKIPKPKLPHSEEGD